MLTDGYLRRGADVEVPGLEVTDGLLVIFSPFTGTPPDIYQTGTLTTLAVLTSEEALAEDGTALLSAALEGAEALAEVGELSVLAVFTGQGGLVFIRGPGVAGIATPPPAAGSPATHWPGQPSAVTPGRAAVAPAQSVAPGWPAVVAAGRAASAATAGQIRPLQPHLPGTAAPGATPGEPHPQEQHAPTPGHPATATPGQATPAASTGESTP